jgi:nicotinamide-nucleotide amidase
MQEQPEEVAAFEGFAQTIRENLGALSYTEEEKELEELVLDELQNQGLRLALAESCTGGLCAQRITKVAGSSRSFWGSAVVYQVAAKEVLLGVKVGDEAQAVSAECSRQLAQQLRERAGCEITAAVTGYMGPAGGTAESPVGTVYIAVQGDSLQETHLTVLGKHREGNQWAASTHVLNLVLKYLREHKKNRQTL